MLFETRDTHYVLQNTDIKSTIRIFPPATTTEEATLYMRPNGFIAQKGSTLTRDSITQLGFRVPVSSITRFSTSKRPFPVLRLELASTPENPLPAPLIEEFNQPGGIAIRFEHVEELKEFKTVISSIQPIFAVSPVLNGFESFSFSPTSPQTVAAPFSTSPRPSTPFEGRFLGSKLFRKNESDDEAEVAKTERLIEFLITLSATAAAKNDSILTGKISAPALPTSIPESPELEKLTELFDNVILHTRSNIFVPPKSERPPPALGTETPEPLNHQLNKFNAALPLEPFETARNEFTANFDSTPVTFDNFISATAPAPAPAPAAVAAAPTPVPAAVAAVASAGCVSSDRLVIWKTLLGLYTTPSNHLVEDEKLLKNYLMLRSQWINRIADQNKYDTVFSDAASVAERDVVRTDRSQPLFSESVIVSPASIAQLDAISKQVSAAEVAINGANSRVAEARAALQAAQQAVETVQKAYDTAVSESNMINSQNMSSVRRCLYSDGRCGHLQVDGFGLAPVFSGVRGEFVYRTRDRVVSCTEMFNALTSDEREELAEQALLSASGTTPAQTADLTRLRDSYAAVQKIASEHISSVTETLNEALERTESASAYLDSVLGTEGAEIIPGVASLADAQATLRQLRKEQSDVAAKVALEVQSIVRQMPYGNSVCFESFYKVCSLSLAPFNWFRLLSLLLTFITYNPTIGYVQSMSDLAALALHVSSTSSKHAGLTEQIVRAAKTGKIPESLIDACDRCDADAFWILQKIIYYHPILGTNINSSVTNTFLHKVSQFTNVVDPTLSLVLRKFASSAPIDDNGTIMIAIAPAILLLKRSFASHEQACRFLDYMIAGPITANHDCVDFNTTLFFALSAFLLDGIRPYIQTQLNTYHNAVVEAEHSQQALVDYVNEILAALAANLRVLLHQLNEMTEQSAKLDREYAFAKQQQQQAIQIFRETERRNYDDYITANPRSGLFGNQKDLPPHIHHPSQIEKLLPSLPPLPPKGTQLNVIAGQIRAQVNHEFKSSMELIASTIVKFKECFVPHEFEFDISTINNVAQDLSDMNPTSLVVSAEALYVFAGEHATEFIEIKI